MRSRPTVSRIAFKLKAVERQPQQKTLMDFSSAKQFCDKQAMTLKVPDPF